MLPKWVLRTIVAAVITEIIRLVFQLIRTSTGPPCAPVQPGSQRPPSLPFTGYPKGERSIRMLQGVNC
jgi:hypothetical protein